MRTVKSQTAVILGAGGGALGREETLAGMFDAVPLGVGNSQHTLSFRQTWDNSCEENVGPRQLRVEDLSGLFFSWPSTMISDEEGAMSFLDNLYQPELRVMEFSTGGCGRDKCLDEAVMQVTGGNENERSVNSERVVGKFKKNDAVHAGGEDEEMLQYQYDQPPQLSSNFRMVKHALELQEEQKQSVGARSVRNNRIRVQGEENGCLLEESIEEGVKLRAAGVTDNDQAQIVEELVGSLGKDIEVTGHILEQHTGEATRHLLNLLSEDSTDGYETALKKVAILKPPQWQTSGSRNNHPLQPIQSAGASREVTLPHLTRRRKRELTCNMWPSHATLWLEDASAQLDLPFSAVSIFETSSHKGSSGAVDQGGASEVRGFLGSGEAGAFVPLNARTICTCNSELTWLGNAFIDNDLHAMRNDVKEGQTWRGAKNVLLDTEREICNCWEKGEREKSIKGESGRGMRGGKLLDSASVTGRGCASAIFSVLKEKRCKLREKKKGTRMLLTRGCGDCAQGEMGLPYLEESGAVAREVGLEGAAAGEFSWMFNAVSSLINEASMVKSANEGYGEALPLADESILGIGNGPRNRVAVLLPRKESLSCSENSAPGMRLTEIEQGVECARLAPPAVLPDTCSLEQSGHSGSNTYTPFKIGTQFSPTLSSGLGLSDRVLIEDKDLLALSAELSSQREGLSLSRVLPDQALTANLQVTTPAPREDSRSATGPVTSAPASEAGIDVLSGDVRAEWVVSRSQSKLPELTVGIDIREGAALSEIETLAASSGVPALMPGDPVLIGAELVAGSLESASPLVVLEGIAEGIALAFRGREGAEKEAEAAAVQSNGMGQFCGWGGGSEDVLKAPHSSGWLGEEVGNRQSSSPWKLPEEGKGVTMGANHSSNWVAMPTVADARDFSSVVQEEVRALLEGREPSLADGRASVMEISPSYPFWNIVGDATSDDGQGLREISAKRMAVERAVIIDGSGDVTGLGPGEGAMGRVLTVDGRKIERQGEREVGMVSLITAADWPLPDVSSRTALLGPASCTTMAQSQGARTVDLSHTRLQKWDSAALSQRSPSAVVMLNLSHNILRSLPDELGQFQALHRIDVQANQLRTLPDSIGMLTGLQYLNLRQNRIDKIPDSVGCCTGLAFLHLDCNKLRGLPDSMQNLQNLQVLTFSLNKVPGLPEWLGKLTSLVELDAHYNLIRSIPPSVGQLLRLRRLNLSYNFTALKMLPPSVGTLTDLRVLSLSYNHMERLPLELGGLTALETLELFGNFLEDPPPNVVRCGTRAVLVYLAEKARRRVQDVDNLPEEELRSDWDHFFGCLPLVVSAAAVVTDRWWHCARDTAVLIRDTVHRGYEAWTNNCNFLRMVSGSNLPIHSHLAVSESLLHVKENSEIRNNNSNTQQFQSDASTIRNLAPFPRTSTSSIYPTYPTRGGWNLRAGSLGPSMKLQLHAEKALSDMVKSTSLGSTTTDLTAVAATVVSGNSTGTCHISGGGDSSSVNVLQCGTLRNSSRTPQISALTMVGATAMTGGSGLRPSQISPAPTAMGSAVTAGSKSPALWGVAPFGSLELLARGSTAEAVMSPRFIGSPEKGGLRGVYGSFLGDVSSSFGLPRSSPRRHQWSEERTPIRPFEDNIFPSTQRSSLYGMIEGQQKTGGTGRPATGYSLTDSPITHERQGKRTLLASSVAGGLSDLRQQGGAGVSHSLTGGRGSWEIAGKAHSLRNPVLPEVRHKSGAGQGTPFGRGPNRRQHTTSTVGIDSMRGSVGGFASALPPFWGGESTRCGTSDVRFQTSDPNLSFFCEERFVCDGGRWGAVSSRGDRAREGSQPPLLMRRASWSMHGGRGPAAALQALHAE